ncbi:MAG: ribosome biogenesis GTPase Der [Candidatus Melainabacteria bacterium]|nr:ribosome biogenesis GTPase Der [Candidatus Melainabacteria bacterium]
MEKPVVAIVGCPNVGKSTFFNRCVGSRAAIVDDMPGVTRDRLYSEADWAGHRFYLVDTGGLVIDSKEEIETQVRRQAQLAIGEADVIVFLVDGKSGLSGSDQSVANLLRRTDKPVILAVNKIDEPHEEANVPEFYQLGLGEPIGISAMRGSGGVGDLLDQVVKVFPHAKPKETRSHEESNAVEKTSFGVAIVGRPNVGKSSLLNALCGVGRSIVSTVPGTTRDAIDTIIKFKGQEITLTDTAGIRRKSKVPYGIEAFAVVRALKAISRSDVVVLLLDATDEISDQDQKIAARIDESGKAAVIVLNKWDLVEDRSSASMNKFVDEVRRNLPHLKYSEVIFVSAVTKQRVMNILEAAQRAYEASCKRVGTHLVNRVINEAVALVPPPASKRGKRLRAYYSTQVANQPPTFVIFINEDKLLTDSYKVYLERKIREAFGFQGTAIRILARAKERQR